MKFEIAITSLSSIHIRKEWGMYDHVPVEELTPDQLVKILKGEDRCSSLSDDDHPDFVEMRNTLEEQGYIKTQRSWWNGDTVTKDFIFCGSKFKKGDSFPCGAAMKGHLKFMKKNRRVGIK